MQNGASLLTHSIFADNDPQIFACPVREENIFVVCLLFTLRFFVFFLQLLQREPGIEVYWNGRLIPEAYFVRFDRSCDFVPFIFFLPLF